MQFENNKKQRRNIFAQAAARGNEWGGSPIPPPVPVKDHMSPRMRSGSGTSRTTATSDSGEPDNLITGQLSSSPPQASTGSSSPFFGHSLSGHRTGAHGSPPNGTTSQAPSGSTKKFLPNPPANPASALSPIANRMRERDADAMEKYLLRSRSGSQGTSSTDTKSQSGSTFASAGPSANGDDITALISGSVTPRRLRPSVSAAQLRTTQPGSGKCMPPVDTRNGSSTSPTTTRRGVSPLPLLTRSSSMSKSLRSFASVDRLSFDETEEYTTPSSQYARFPAPPPSSIVKEENSVPATNGRRKGFHILSKPLQNFESSTGSSHQRKTSAASTRGS